MRVNAYAAPAAGQPLAPTVIERRDVGSNDVLIEIQYAGICHSDIHTVNGDWGPQPFPVVPGHEIVGVVAEGRRRRHQAQGRRPGRRRLHGELVRRVHQLPQRRRAVLLRRHGSHLRRHRPRRHHHPGGYSTHVVVDSDYVLTVPDGIDSAAAAPLLCAGITTYAPLRRWGAGPGKRVAVVGLGGLGHMAVKIAHALGAEVTVLSQSLKKQEDGLRLGADHYFATSDPATFEQLDGRFDLIVNTVSAHIDVDAYLSLLAVDGTLVNVGAPAEPLSLNVFSLISARRSYAGSMIGGIALTQEMLFCARHSIGSEVEVIPASQVNEAYERVLASDVRYRFVIDTATLS